MAQITKDTGIIEAVQKYPQIIEIFQQYGLGCIGCMAAHFETIGQGAGAHGIDVDALRSQFDGIPETVDSVSGDVEALSRILSTDDEVLCDASAYIVLSRVMEARRGLAKLDEALRGMSSELTDGIERADERCRRERRDERRTREIDEWQRKVADAIGAKAGVPFDGGTVGEYEDFVSRHRKSAGAPHTIGMTNRQRGFVSAIGRMLHVQHPHVMSVAEASAFIEQYGDAYKMARDAADSE